MARVAVVGLGTMGAPMARNLVAAGHDVVGFDLDPARALTLGLAPAASVAEAAAEAEAILLSLPSPRAVEEVARAAAAAAPRGGLLVDMSTSPPELARRLAAELEPGVDVLDAPVSGGPRGAEEATLTIMVGGRDPAFDRVRPVLEALGSRVVHVGAHGAGQAAKLCNNLIAGVAMAAISEACAVAEREGLDPAMLYELLTSSTADSRVLRTRFPLAGVDSGHPSSNAFAPMFMVDLIAKDLGLALDLAAAHDVDARVARTALTAYERAQARGLGALDYSAVFLAVRPEPA
jgi:3-hydroxyisobutyrate dehydrogenase